MKALSPEDKAYLIVHRWLEQCEADTKWWQAKPNLYANIESLINAIAVQIMHEHRPKDESE